MSVLQLFQNYFSIIIWPLLLFLTLVGFFFYYLWLRFYFFARMNNQHVSSNPQKTAVTREKSVPEKFRTDEFGQVTFDAELSAVSISTTDIHGGTLQAQPNFMSSNDFGAVYLEKVTDGYKGKREFKLSQAHMIFGGRRDQQNHPDVVIEHPFVSGEHFSITYRGKGDYVIRNLSDKPHAMLCLSSEIENDELQHNEERSLHALDRYRIRSDHTDLVIEFKINAPRRGDLTK